MQCLQDNMAHVVPDLDYKIYYKDNQQGIIGVHRHGCVPEFAEDVGDFLYLFEKDMTVALESIRPELFFLHAAALEYNGGIHLLVAESGGGKSTTAWALLHHGFRYASDELAPVVLESMKILTYPHALCLKSVPPAPYNLPKETLYTERTLHVPVNVLPSLVVKDVLSLQSIFFVKYHAESTAPSIQDVTTAQAGARVYANGLNQLAHPSDGLDAAIQIARHSQCFELHTADLGMTCKLVTETLGEC